MSGKSDILRPSPPSTYNLNLPEQLKRSTIHKLTSSTVRQALELVGYMAVQNTPPLIDVLDSLKAFSILLCVGEIMSKPRRKGDPALEILRQYGRNEILLDFDDMAEMGQSLKLKAYRDFTDSFSSFVISIYYGILKHHYSIYRDMPQCALSKPDKIGILRYPNIRRIQELLEQNSAIPEVETALPILYILIGEVDRAIEIYEAKCMMGPYDYYNLGTVYLKKSCFSMAREQLERATELGLAQYNLGVTYLYEEDWGKAAECFEPLTKILHEIDYQMFHDRAISFVDHVIAQAASNNLGICHYRGGGRIIEALDCFETALSCGVFTGYDYGVWNKACLVAENWDIFGPVEQKDMLQGDYGIIGKSSVMKEIFQKIRILSPTDGNVLITGETGTGKELVARAVHNESKRKGKFIAIDCGTLQRDLAGSELFGHEKGAFTGAVELRRGAFELANDGTLFLDEISNMSMELQVKLLRVVEGKPFRRIGGHKDIEVNVRILSATNENLAEAVKHGRFREDLYYRINRHVIELPPLRERKEDIPLITRSFLEQYTKETFEEALRIDQRIFRLLQRYSWPGNVRELENVIAQAAARAKDQAIRFVDLPNKILEELRNDKDVEKIMIIEALKRHKGSASAAIKDLPFERTKFYELLKKYRIKPKEYKPAK